MADLTNPISKMKIEPSDDAKDFTMVCDIPVYEPPRRTSIYPASRNTRLLTQHLRAQQAALPTQPRHKRKKKTRAKRVQPPISPEPEAMEFEPEVMKFEAEIPTAIEPEPEVHAQLETFHPFPKLTTELRLKVWKAAIFEPRKIKVTLDWTPHWEIDRSTTPETGTFTARPLMSVEDCRGTLRACKESHQETKRLLKGKLQATGIRGLQSVYFDPSLDTIVLDAWSLYTPFYCNFQIQVEDMPDWPNQTTSFDFSNSPFQGFGAIQNLEIERTKRFSGIGQLLLLLGDQRFLGNVKMLKLLKPSSSASEGMIARYARSVQKAIKDGPGEGDTKLPGPRIRVQTLKWLADVGDTVRVISRNRAVSRAAVFPGIELLIEED